MTDYRLTLWEIDWNEEQFWFGLESYVYAVNYRPVCLISVLRMLTIYMSILLWVWLEEREERRWWREFLASIAEE